MQNRIAHGRTHFCASRRLTPPLGAPRPAPAFPLRQLGRTVRTGTRDGGDGLLIALLRQLGRMVSTGNRDGGDGLLVARAWCAIVEPQHNLPRTTCRTVRQVGRTSRTVPLLLINLKASIFLIWKSFGSTDSTRLPRGSTPGSKVVLTLLRGSQSLIARQPGGQKRDGDKSIYLNVARYQL